MIVMDGTHTSTKLDDFKHIILIAVTYDAYNEIVILAFALVDVENKDNWVWFHDRLSEDFPDFNVIMCDADKGIRFRPSISPGSERLLTWSTRRR